MSEVTQILNSAQGSDPVGADELLPLVYDELRKLAAARLAGELPGQTLQPTALVHEAWLRLVGQDKPRFQNGAHFFAAAAEAMRRILIDNARRKQAARRGGGQVRVELSDAEMAPAHEVDNLLALDEALEQLSAHDHEIADLVKLKFFVGLTNREAADALAVSLPTVERWWAFARAWLYRQLGGAHDGATRLPRPSGSPESH